MLSLAGGRVKACSETYLVKGCEQCSCSELNTCSNHTYPISSLPFLSSPPVTCRLCCAEELLLGTAVSLQRCPLVGAPCVPGARPSSAAEDVIFSSSLLSLEIPLGLRGWQLLIDNRVISAKRALKSDELITSRQADSRSMVQQHNRSCRPCQVANAPSGVMVLWLLVSVFHIITSCKAPGIRVRY